MDFSDCSGAVEIYSLTDVYRQKSLNLEAPQFFMASSSLFSLWDDGTMHQARPSNYRFGDFELRTETETLLRNGVPVPLQRLPFLMLSMLLEQPNQVVTRDALQNRLWGSQGYLQFENGLHVAAAKLREALGDTAASPKYIKTVPRRGYQFVVEDLVVVDPWAAPASVAAFAEAAPVSQVVPSIPRRRIGDLQRDQDRRATRRRKSDLPLWSRDRHSGWRLTLVGSRRLHGTIGVVIAAFLILLPIVWIYRAMHNTRVAPNQTVMLGSFYNRTKDARLDGVYDFPFQLKMQESQYLHLVETGDPEQPAEPSMPKTVTDEIAQCRVEKASFLLTGQLDSRGKGYAVRLSSWNCADGRLLASETTYADGPTATFGALDNAAIALRQDLGEAPESLRLLDAPAAKATTNSIAALRAFHMGESKLTAATIDEAIAYYKLATDLDPQFASAYDRMGLAYYRKGQADLSKKALTTAFQLRDHVTDHERLSITSHYYDGVTYDLPAADQTYELWIKMYPNDPDPLDTLASTYLKALGEPRKALALAERAVALNPAGEQSNLNLLEAHLDLGDFAYLNDRCSASPSSKVKIVPTHIFCYVSFFGQGDETGMRREVELSQGAVQQGAILNEAGDVAIYRGQLALAKQLFMQSRKNLLKTHLPDFAAWIQARQAVLEAAAGMKGEAKDDALSAAKLDRNAGTMGLAAWTLAVTGDRVQAESMSKDASDFAPTDTLLNLQILGCADALLSLNDRNPQDAIESLNKGRPYAFGLNTFLAPAYYRGLALEELHDSSAAISAFKSVIDHRNTVPESIFVPLAKLELGHVLKESGDKAGATALFGELDGLWAHADDAFEPKQRLLKYERP